MFNFLDFCSPNLYILPTVRYDTRRGMIRMRAVFDRKELLKVLRAFYELTGLRTVVFDAEGQDILSYPAQRPQFCELVRRTPAGEAACRHCDQSACLQAQREKHSVLYPCHAGLIEVITPMQADGVTVGYLLLSHVVQGEDEAAEWQSVRERCAALDLPMDELRTAYRALPHTSYQKLNAASELLALAAKGAYQAQLARLVPGSMAEKLNRYLETHLAEPIGSDELCRELEISRTSLYHLAKESYGCGAAEQLTRMRMQKAAVLLTVSDLTIEEISRQCGYSDYEYFFRVFRKRMGQTPKSYRTQYKKTDSV